MARKTTTQTVATPATKKATPVATKATIAVVDGVSPRGAGLVGNIMRGWEVFDRPGVEQMREAAHQRRLDEAEAYFRDKLAAS